jgi:tripartite-type tricarboxylate transporter receptor subunit TctC
MPVHSVSDLIALAKSEPGMLRYGSAGVGFTNHLGMELFKLKAGKLRAIAVPGANRSELTPGLPTIAETIPV